MLFQSLSSMGFALSLPVILLMYMLKRTYLDTEVSSSLLWRKALREQEANRPWQKLRNRLLLLLQLAAAVMLVLALMEPAFTGRAAAGRKAAVVLDTSASMTARTVGSNVTAFESAVSELRAWLEEQSASASITLITTGEDPKVEASGSPKTIQEALDRIRPQYGSADAAAGLTLADAAIRGEPDGEIVFVSDGRSVRPERLRLAAPVRTLQVQPAAGNAAIAAFGIRENGDSNQGRSAVVTVMNQGHVPLSGTLTIEAPGVKEKLFAADYKLNAGERRTFRGELDAEAPYYRASIDSGSADGFASDDVAYAFPASGKSSRRALLVSRGNLFLDKALQLAGVQTVRAVPGTYEPDEQTMKTVDWVLVDGGVRESDLRSESWNKLLASKPVWRLWSAESPPEGGSAVVPDSGEAAVKDHPVVHYVTFQGVHIAKLVVTRAGEQLGDPVVTYGGKPAIYAGRSDGKPAIVFAFDLHDSDLPLKPEFPILVAQAADWMGGGITAYLGQAVAGSRVEVQRQTAAVSARWEPVEVLYGDRQAMNAIVESDDQGMPSGEQIAPGLPGLYRYVEYGEDGNVLSGRLLAVVSAPEEGGVAQNGPAGAGSLDGTAGNAGAGTSTGSATTSDRGSTDDVISASELVDRSSAIPWICALLLLLIAAEWEVYRRGTAG
ncbi:VWA domain-containing protein [Cohnella sp. CFH 77786]|uniref:vWA domain-containing protein n=1 Tax=Cohnella sp. CFH 77786 TaxID=2662265 RepID=UPI001C60FE60|nr:BatA and WFA domain-containing protein [Cohnella sp. CFH 77786]MBW5448059.1 VWA domain-containing protein [Cohnella sp. CFH 77786]